MSDDEDVGNRSTDELFFVAEEEPRRPPRRATSPRLRLRYDHDKNALRLRYDYDTTAPRRPPRRRRSPLKPVHTLASPRPTPQASPVNSTGVKIVIDRISSDDAEPTVVLGSPRPNAAAERDSASAEAVAALRTPHSAASTGAEHIEATPVTPTTGSALRMSASGKTDSMPESSSQVFLLDDMA